MAEAAKAPKRKTRAELEADLADVVAKHKGELETYREHSRAAAEDARQAREREKATRADNNDLKTRLVAAEASNQRMRGYIDRVQEDDVVREELIITGAPGGEQQIVPKRKPTRFEQPLPYTISTVTSGFSDFAIHNDGRVREQPRHWVTY